MGRKAGLSDEKLRAVPTDDRTPFNETERFVVELADAMTDTPADVSDDLYGRLRNQFSEEQLMQLGAQIAFENYRARWNRSSMSRAIICTRPNQVSRKNHDKPECAMSILLCWRHAVSFDSSSTFRLFSGQRWKRQQTRRPSTR